jgi:hypothetical protein
LPYHEPILIDMASRFVHFLNKKYCSTGGASARRQGDDPAGLDCPRLCRSIANHLFVAGDRVGLEATMR